MAKGKKGGNKAAPVENKKVDQQDEQAKADKSKETQ